VSLDPGTADFDDYRGKFIVHTLSRGEKKTIAMYIKIIGDTDQEPNESVKVEVLAQGKNGAGTVVEQSPVTNGEFWIVNDDWPVPHGQDSPPTVSHKVPANATADATRVADGRGGATLDTGARPFDGTSTLAGASPVLQGRHAGTSHAGSGGGGHSGGRRGEDEIRVRDEIAPR